MIAFVIGVVVVVVIAAGLVHLRRQTVGTREGAIEFRTLALTGPVPPGTLAASSDGVARVFFSSSGVIDGGGDVDVAAASKNLLREANKYVGTLKAASDLLFPTFGAVRFFVRTADGNFTHVAAEPDLASGRDSLSSLYAAGQELMKQLRMLSSD